MSIIALKHLEIIILDGNQAVLVKVKDGHITDLEPLNGVQNSIQVNKRFGVKSKVYGIIVDTVVKVICKSVGQVSYLRLIDKMIVEFSPDSANRKMWCY